MNWSYQNSKACSVLVSDTSTSTDGDIITASKIASSVDISNKNISTSANSRQKPAATSANTGSGGNNIDLRNINLINVSNFSQHDMSIAPSVFILTSNRSVNFFKLLNNFYVSLHDGVGVETINSTSNNLRNSDKLRSKRDVGVFSNKVVDFNSSVSSLESGSDNLDNMTEKGPSDSFANNIYSFTPEEPVELLHMDKNESKQNMDHILDTILNVPISTHDNLDSSEIWERLVKGLLSKEKHDGNTEKYMYSNVYNAVTDRIVDNHSENDNFFDSMVIETDLNKPSNIRAKKDNIKLIERTDLNDGELVPIQSQDISRKMNAYSIETSAQSGPVDIIEITETNFTNNTETKETQTQNYKLIQQDFSVVSYDLDENVSDDDFTEIAYDYDVHEEQIQPFINSAENDVQRLWNGHARSRSEQTQQPEWTDVTLVSKAEVLSTPSADLNIHTDIPLAQTSSPKYEHISLKTDAPLDLFPSSTGNNVLVNISISGANTPIYVLSLTVPTGQNQPNGLSMPSAAFSLGNNDNNRIDHRIEQNKGSNILHTPDHMSSTDINSVASTKSPPVSTLIPGYRIWGGQCQCSCPCMNDMDKVEDKDYIDDKDWDVDYPTKKTIENNNSTDLIASTTYDLDNYSEEDWLNNSTDTSDETQYTTEYFESYLTSQRPCAKIDYWAEIPPAILILEGKAIY